MAESKELKKIKKLYGEKFMHLCRELFPTILEHEGLLTEVLQKYFATNNRTLGEDITEELKESFKNFIFSQIDVEKEKSEIFEDKTPYELMEEAGYDLYECTSEEEIQSFKKYYKSGEQLCTFGGGRLDRCVVFWAVKKGVDGIKREDFHSPKRDDEYGTSVMSIQFSKFPRSIVSIKNRYNHTVNNPDATYGNDLDKIIPGLTQSFAAVLSERGYNLDDSNVERFEIPGYTVGPDGKYYKYNMEIGGVYFCPGNVIINGSKIIHLAPEKYILMDYFILDKENKEIYIYDVICRAGFRAGFTDSFIDYFRNIESIQVEKDDNLEKGARRISIQVRNSDTPAIIEIDRDNSIIGYKNDELKFVGDYFLNENKKLRHIELQNVTYIGDEFLINNCELKQLKLPNVTNIGLEFLIYNQTLEQLELLNLKEEKGCFLYFNRGLKEMIAPNLKVVGDGFLVYNSALEHIELSKNEAHRNNPDITRLFEIIERNRQKNVVNGDEIAKLDRDSSLTTTEINEGQELIEKTTAKEKDGSEKAVE